MLSINDIIIIIINRTPLGFLRGKLVVVVVRREDFASSINLKIGYVLQMGIKFWKFEKKLPQNFGSSVLAPLETLKMGFWAVFEGHV